MTWRTLHHADPRHRRIALIDWNLGNVCNFSCSYCPPSLHSGTTRWPSLSVIFAFGDRVVEHHSVHGYRTFFQFTGGEPTLYPDLLVALAHFKERGSLTGVISNGSRKIAWWQRAAELLDNVVLTQHIEETRLTDFIAVATWLSERVNTHVNVTMLPDRFNECLERATAIHRECPRISISLKPLLVGFGDVLYPYTEEQRRVMMQFDGRRKAAPPLQTCRGTMAYQGDDGNVTLTTAARLVTADQNHWPGWTCYVGVENLCIASNGDCYRGICREGGKLGTIYDEAIRFPENPLTCTKATCHCLTDILTTKLKRRQEAHRESLR
jgi:hypothetical protein